MSDVCKSCGAAIIWITDQKGTRLPVNKTQVRIYEKFTDGKWRFCTTLEGPELIHISHFLTCPDATKHSKRQETQPGFAPNYITRLQSAVTFLEMKGYRRCDTPACNCGSWHKEDKRNAD